MTQAVCLYISNPLSHQTPAVHSGQAPDADRAHVGRCPVAAIMAARHDHEIVRDGRVHVYLDHRHIGSGGDDSWSPSVHKAGGPAACTSCAVTAQRLVEMPREGNLLQLALWASCSLCQQLCCVLQLSKSVTLLSPLLCKPFRSAGKWHLGALSLQRSCV